MRYLLLILVVLGLLWLSIPNAPAQCPNCPNGVCPYNHVLPAFQPPIQVPDLPPATVSATKQQTVEVTVSAEVVEARQPIRNAVNWREEHKPVRRAIAGVARFIFHRRR